MSPISEVSAQDYSFDRLERHIYGGIGIGASNLSPDTSEVPGVDRGDDSNVGAQFTLGMDFNKWFSIEGHGATLGEAGFTPDGTISYREFGASALFYAGKARHRWKRHGLTGYGRLGFGYLSNVGSEGLVFEQDNAVHFLLGLGAEWMSRRGLGVRAEFIAYDQDLQYGQLGLIYRFGSREERVIEQVVQAPQPVAPKPAPVAPVAALQVTDNDQDGVDNSIDQCPTTGQGVAVDERGCAIFSGVIEGVNFRTSSAELLDSAPAILDGVVMTLKQYPNTRFKITAHTDSQGSAESNKELSKQRAITVAKFFIKSGIARSRFSVRAYGEAQPIDTNETAEGRRRNRRVELHIIK